MVTPLLGMGPTFGDASCSGEPPPYLRTAELEGAWGKRRAECKVG